MHTSWLFGAFSGLLATRGAALNEEISSLLAVQKRSVLEESALEDPPQLSETPYGVILWSDGRSGSTSFFKTLSGITRAAVCNDEKESFAEKNLTLSALRACAEQHTRPSMMHLKPSHLTQKNSELRTPFEFFEAAKAAGYSFVVGNFRENQLARDLACVDKGWRNHTGTPQEYVAERREYNDALLAARKTGLDVIPMSFSDIVTDTCQAARLVLSTVANRTGVEGKQLWKKLEHKKCAKVDRQTLPRDHADLSQRTSANVAKDISSLFDGTEFGWMLNTTVHSWPDTNAPSVPVVTSLAKTGMTHLRHTEIDRVAMERWHEMTVAIDDWKALQNSEDRLIEKADDDKDKVEQKDEDEVHTGSRAKKVFQRLMHPFRSFKKQADEEDGDVALVEDVDNDE